jgi:hypothetical protein
MATNTSHPITLAEFLYVGKVTPTFRNAMLKGREWTVRAKVTA